MQSLIKENCTNYDLIYKKLSDRITLKIIKKDGTLEDYDEEKIKKAIKKASERALDALDDTQIDLATKQILFCLLDLNETEIPVNKIHNVVESVLQKFDKDVAQSYRDYRNYKQDFVHMLDKVYQENQRIMYIGDKENSNIDSTLVSTKRTLVYNELSKELYKKFFLTKEELQAAKDGYIYIHDMSARLNTMNCFSRSTRFITSQGVRSFEDFCDGDHVFVPTHDGSWHDAVVRNYGKQKLQKVVFKRCSKGTKEVFCTANHRWLLKDGTETTNLKVGDKLILTPDISTIDWDNATIEQKKWWVNGFCLGDGYTVKEGRSKGQTTIRLFGYKVEYRNRFEEVGCTVTQPDWMIRSYGVGNAYSVYMGVTFDKNNFSFKDVPFDCLKYLCDGYLCADGHRIRKNSNLSSYFHGVSVSGKNLEFVYDMLNICGYYVTKTIDQTERVTNYGSTSTPSYRYGFYSNQGCRGWVVQAIEPYEEQDVWCLEVEKNHSFILENGIVTGNCCLFDVAEVLKGGFEMGNIWYNEPKTLEVAFDVIGDIVMSASAQQYGGFTVPEVDKILEPYAKKSFKKYEEKYISLGVPSGQAKIQAMKDVQQDFEQGFQGWEYKFNTVASSRGDYPFITVTSGLSTTEFGRMCNFAMLKVRKNGQGKKENKKPVLFPKIVFLYDKDLHSEGKPLYDVYKAGVECSKKTMYPDWLSLTGEGYVPSMYKKYKRVVSPMGCVAGNSRLKIWTDDPVSDIIDIETFWQRLACTNPVKGQTNEMDCNKIIDLTDKNYAVWDTKLEKYVKIKYIIRNIQDNWVNVTITNGFNITATQDHPFEVEGKGIVHGIDLRIGDRILTANGINLVSKLEYFTDPDYAYDLTTESEHFEVNGIYSHNCRAFLSPWYEKGGEKPIDENDKPIFVGRFNIGAVSLHLPMILAKARQEGKDFYEVLDYYMELIRNLHKRTYDYLGELKASTNPLAYCEGGFYGGHLNYTDKIKPLLKAATASFGITALNELQQLYNKKSLVEDGQFALEVMDHITKKVNEFKAEDGHLYAQYGTPAESLTGLQVEQFRKKYGIIENVSDRLYVSNSFHCHVTEDITPIEKQDLEKRFWDTMNGGKIQYVRYPIDYNTKAVDTLIRRAMDMGFYEGVNLELSYCDDCGHQELDMDVCPVCGSSNLTKISRMNGYLSYSRVKGDSRLNDAKMAEIHDRKSM